MGGVLEVYGSLGSHGGGFGMSMVRLMNFVSIVCA